MKNLSDFHTRYFFDTPHPNSNGFKWGKMCSFLLENHTTEAPNFVYMVLNCVPADFMHACRERSDLFILP